ncbi:hypothetical protein BDV98DRAFT_598452 [Pterulicium gracile]|uniref:Uncharacterized protein n=1 Tax=Pterulicium gracile TaxID=1884261 RepID=A0A5C3Q350_9AGAR|nr:hypothetical protein BDV98DRAFT_598452 [Pterula gracilis]
MFMHRIENQLKMSIDRFAVAPGSDYTLRSQDKHVLEDELLEKFTSPFLTTNLRDKRWVIRIIRMDASSIAAMTTEDTPGSPCLDVISGKDAVGKKGGSLKDLLVERVHHLYQLRRGQSIGLLQERLRIVQFLSSCFSESRRLPIMVLTVLKSIFQCLVRLLLLVDGVFQLNILCSQLFYLFSNFPSWRDAAWGTSFGAYFGWRNPSASSTFKARGTEERAVAL